MAATFKIEKLNDYTVMANHHLRNRKLSLKAKGLQSLMLSLPEEWDYSLKGLAAICKDGVDSISSTLRELEEAGYVSRKRRRNEKGQLTDTEYIIYQIPKPSENNTDEKKPKRENPDQAENHDDAPKASEPEQEKPDQVKSRKKPKRENPVLAEPVQAEPDKVKRPQLNIQELNKQESSIQSIYQSCEKHKNRKKSEMPDREIDDIKEYIKTNIEYDIACERFKKETVDDIVDIMADVYMTDGIITIGKRDYQAKYIQDIFDKIEFDHIEFVIRSFEDASKKNPIRNIKKYLLSSLINSRMTMNSYYNADINYSFG